MSNLEGQFKEIKETQKLIAPELLNMCKIPKDMQALFNIQNYISYITERLKGVELSQNSMGMLNRFVNTFRDEYTKLIEDITELNNSECIVKSSLERTKRQIKTLMDIILQTESSIQLMEENYSLNKGITKMGTLGQESINTLEETANRDFLTGLPNRLALDNFFPQILNSPKKTEYHLVYFDLIDFKAINDNLSHETGDKILKILAGIIKEYNSYRVGGDEFIIISGPGENIVDITDTIQKQFLAAIEKYNDLNNTDINSGIRFGITPIFENDKDPDAIQNLADTVSYLTKILNQENEEDPLYTKQGTVLVDEYDPEYCTCLNIDGFAHTYYKVSDILEAKKILEGRDERKRTRREEDTLDDKWHSERIRFKICKEIAEQKSIPISEVTDEQILEYLA